MGFFGVVYVKLYFETYGCTMNQSDTEIAMAMVEDHELTGLGECEVAVINSCGVIGFTERKILRRVAYLKKLGKKVVLIGCLPKINFEAAERSKADAITSLGLLNKALENLDDERFINLSDDLDKSCAAKKRKEGAIAIVSISEGCLGKCSYCATKFARGRLKSFPIDSLIKEVEDCVAKGYKEIRLTAQDTGSYGIDTGERLPELLKGICRIPGDFRVRVGMMNPSHVVGIVDDLLDAFAYEKVYKFIHIPVQSGDDEVLRDMKRGHTVEDFEAVVDAFRKNFDDLTLSTDVIVGYPTEGDASFWKTYRLIEEVRPDILNITRFSPRPRTKAAELKDILDRDKKDRSRKLTLLHKKIGKENNRRYLGRELEVLITEEGKDGTLLARTNSYKQVVLRKGVIGEFTRAKIKEAMPTYLIGE